jgi:succinate dehydrogenase / fumarate reductase flavoprotein subunit
MEIYSKCMKNRRRDPYVTPMMIYPAVHYTMGGTWVDYNLQTTIPGCFSIGESFL